MLRPILIGMLCVLTTVYAASTADQFEVAKTKLLYLLSTGQTAETLEFLDANGTTFTDTSFSQSWYFWTAVAYSRTGQLNEARELFDRLDAIGFEQPQFALEFGLLQIKQKQFSQAINRLSTWQQANPDSPQGNYYLALANYEQGKYDVAKQRLAEILTTNAAQQTQGFQLDQAVYLYAATLKNLQEYREAKVQLDKIIEWPGGSRYAAAAQDVMSAIAIEEQQNKKLVTSVQLTSAIDSNVTLSKESLGVDGRGALQANASYRVTSWLTPSYQVFLSRHIQSQDYDLLVNSFGLSSEGQFGQVNAGGDYQLATHQLAGESWLTKHRAEIWLKKNAVKTSASISVQQFSDTNNVVFDLSSVWQTRLATLEMPLSIQPFVNVQTSTDFDVQSFGLGTNIRLNKNIEDWQLSAQTQVEYILYTPSADKSRALDTELTVHVGRRLTSSLSANMKVDLINSLVQPDSASYFRSVGSASIVWRF